MYALEGRPLLPYLFSVATPSYLALHRKLRRKFRRDDPSQLYQVCPSNSMLNNGEITPQTGHSSFSVYLQAVRQLSGTVLSTSQRFERPIDEL